MGNITNITNNNSQNDIENYFLTMLDAFAEGRGQAMKSLKKLGNDDV